MIHWEGIPTGFGESGIGLAIESSLVTLFLSALNYPYVLAFEPTFVEIRNVETGLMSQVIQGNNLRLLFADTPPSTTNTASSFNQPYGQYQQPYGSYNSSPAPSLQPSTSRSSLQQNGYGPPQHGNNMYQQQTRHPQPPYGRDEIILVSDDRIMRLQMVQAVQDQCY